MAKKTGNAPERVTYRDKIERLGRIEYSNPYRAWHSAAVRNDEGGMRSAHSDWVKLRDRGAFDAAEVVQAKIVASEPVRYARIDRRPSISQRVSSFKG